MVGISRLLPKNYLFTILGIAVGVAGLVALGAMAERITRFIDGGDRFVLGQISVAGEGMGMGTGFTAGGLLRASRIEQIARVPGVAAVQAQVMLPLNPTTSQFLTLTQELILGVDPGVPMPNRQIRELPVRSGRFLRANDRGVVVVGALAVAKRGGAVPARRARAPAGGRPAAGSRGSRLAPVAAISTCTKHRMVENRRYLRSGVMGVSPSFIWSRTSGRPRRPGPARCSRAR